MDDLIFNNCILTVCDASSHYGTPVLRIDGYDDPFGPADLFPTPYDVYDSELFPNADSYISCADVVKSLVKRPDVFGVEELTDDQIQGCVNYLRQWPDGPQLKGEKY